MPQFRGLTEAGGREQAEKWLGRRREELVELQRELRIGEHLSTQYPSLERVSFFSVIQGFATPAANAKIDQIELCAESLGELCVYCFFEEQGTRVYSVPPRFQAGRWEGDDEIGEFLIANPGFEESMRAAGIPETIIQKAKDEVAKAASSAKNE